MNRKRAPCTQKQRAIRRGICALLFLAALVLMLPVSFSPVQILRQAEAEYSTGETTLLAKREGENASLLLSANEHAILLTGCRLRFPYGWYRTAVLTLDRSQEDGPVCACYDNGSGWQRIQIIGVTTLADAVFVRACDAQSDAGSGGVHSSNIVWTVPVLSAENGMHYFWFCEKYGADGSCIWFQTLEFLDQRGQVLYTYDLPQI